jgi:DNA-binding SARP family transcriptional activator
VTVDGRVLRLAAKSQRLLALLALRERPQPRRAIAGTLWIDRTDRGASANLRTALWKLGADGHRLIAVDGNLLALADEVTVDFRTVLRQARNLVQHAGEATSQGAEAPPSVDAFAGDLLPDWDEDWILFERERLRQLRIHAMEALTRRFIAARRYAEAVDAGLAAVAADVLRESAHRALIEAYIGEGNIADARRQYEQFRSLLWDSLSLQPSADLARLVGT